MVMEVSLGLPSSPSVLFLPVVDQHFDGAHNAADREGLDSCICAVCLIKHKGTRLPLATTSSTRFPSLT